MANYNLTNQEISASFQQLMQHDRDTSLIYDGTGSLIDNIYLSGSITASFSGDGSGLTNIPSASFAVSASHATTASYAESALSASHALVADNAIEIFVSAKNTSGFDIPKGTAVHSSGVTGDKININTASYDNPNLMPAIGITQELISNNAVGEVILTGRIEGINTANLTEGQTVYVNGDGSLTSTKPTGSALIQNIGTCVKSNATEGEILVLGSGRTNDLPNIQEGYFWVGDSNGVPQTLPTSSVEPSGFVTTGSFNSFTSSYYNDSASFDSRIANIQSSGSGADWNTNLANIPSGLVSGSSQLTGSFATLQGNTFNGNQIVTGSVDVSQAVVATQVQASEAVVTSTIDSTSGNVTIGNANLIVSGNVQLEPNRAVNATQLQANESVITSLIETTSGNVTIGNGNLIVSGNIELMPNRAVSATQFQASEAVITPIIESIGSEVIVQDSLGVSGSINMSGVTGQNISNPNGAIQGDEVQAFTSLIAPQLETGGGTFTIQNNTVVSGSLTLSPNQPFQAQQIQAIGNVVTPTLESTTGVVQIPSTAYFRGSIKSDVESVTITSNSASIDFSSVQMQVLELPASGDTHIYASNTDNGQVVNLLIKSTGTTATVSFAPNILQPSGSGFEPTPVNGGRDILTFSTFDKTTTNEVYLVNVVNLV
jgi:hypothetical protein